MARHSGQPRRAAYDVLAAVEDRAAYANLLLPSLLAERSITGRDAALATELAYGTLRGLGTYDAVLAACSDRPLDRLDPPVRHVLRLGTHQLLATRVGAHAAVATSVDLVKSVAGPRASGFVNAVLRRVATRDLDAWLEIVAPDPVTDPDGYLAVRYSHPRWIVAAYRDALGDAGGELAAALDAGNVRPRVSLATFPGGPSPAEVMPDDAAPGRWSPYAFTLASGDPYPLIESGLATVQDEASQLAALALTRAPVAASRGDRPELWLDLCAGPGGKSRLLLGLAAGAPRRLVTARPAGRGRTPPAPRQPGLRRPRAGAGPVGRLGGRGRRRYPAAVARRCLRPRARRRAVHRPRCAPPPSRGPLAQVRF